MLHETTDLQSVNDAVISSYSTDGMAHILTGLQYVSIRIINIGCRRLYDQRGACARLKTTDRISLDPLHLICWPKMLSHIIFLFFFIYEVHLNFYIYLVQAG